MAFRINHNISSINTQRQLENVNRAATKTLEHLSSGMKINTAADGPASLVISENMRAQVTGLNQAVENSETGISMVQTAEGSLNEVNRLLLDVRQLAIHASNAGVNDEKMLAADQAEITNALKTIDRISEVSQFGTKRLLDGSRGANGVTNGAGLQFVSAGSNTRTSQVEGYAVRIDQVATKSAIFGETALTQEMMDAGESFTVSEGGKTVSFTTTAGESVTSNLNELEVKLNEAGLNIDLIRQEDGETTTIGLQHKEYGSEFGFSVASTTAGVLSKVGDVTDAATLGKDVRGTINGEEAVGRGQILTGKSNAPNVKDLSVRYTGSEVTPEDQIAGTVSVFQNSLQFQIGANEGQTVAVSLRNMATRALSQGMNTESGYKSLSEIDVTSFQGAQDAIQMVDKAIEQTSGERGKLGAFQKNTLQSNLNNLRVSAENLTAAESTIRDSDMAQEMADFTRNQIMLQTSTAMLAQANQKEQVVLTLLAG
ncbi:MAG: flagellin [SAR324 cluster bacterium]|nr:flagellin [SAR324 cluster bacterium]